MSLYNLRFFPDFYVCAITRPKGSRVFAGLLQVSVTTRSHKPLSAVIQSLISVIRRHYEILEIASVVVVPNTVPRGD